MYADFYRALCLFAIILKTKIFSSTVVSFGPQNIYDKDKKTVFLPENTELSEQYYSFKYHVYP